MHNWTGDMSYSYMKCDEYRLPRVHVSMRLDLFVPCEMQLSIMSDCLRYNYSSWVLPE
jgi:hypothetical protein